MAGVRDATVGCHRVPGSIHRAVPALSDSGAFTSNAAALSGNLQQPRHHERSGRIDSQDGVFEIHCAQQLHNIMFIISTDESLDGWLTWGSHSTGAEVISLILLFNRLTGLYGLLAILTGYELSVTQLSMYLYSLGVVVLLAMFMPHIRKQSPFETLGLAWLYIVDTILNVAYTTFFAVNWYLNSSALDKHPAGSTTPAAAGPAAAAEIAETALANGAPVVPDVPGTTKHIGPQESWMSLGLICSVTLVRVYFALVVMSFAQQVMQRYTADMGWEEEGRSNAGKKGGVDGPFSQGEPGGEGSRGRIGRVMLALGRGYWLRERPQEVWASAVSAKFRHAGV
ncbi:Inositolphosphorylceramide synthase subunit Kei1-domain-containing protein [Colletotrichum phormii]|uniref:Inositolphosphorylceramide synthase subunit Kei1-domain-containing protein n=1 Tax=Colletotrichum phormii TaxID=359342 RepID=A0AAI9ZP07_9PEZI|nr:Inositolphosphorylceramide synthase subunit Kei1-domain-containing protein [Colletotrichum phormii]KAK1635506.1 Inositolphosphorylceramide synthase subunit Kei1-domain-containing protein [Colletotrichum phormii]